MANNNRLFEKKIANIRSDRLTFDYLMKSGNDEIWYSDKMWDTVCIYVKDFRYWRDLHQLLIEL